MPRGPGKKSNYNLEYSRFNGVGTEDKEQPELPSDLPPMQEMMRALPTELQQASHLMLAARTNQDAAGERRAQELILAAMQKATPEVQQRFIAEIARQSPESAKALDATVSVEAAPPAKVSSGPEALSNTIDTLRQQMETGAEAARNQMDALQKQQEQLERMKSPEDLINFMHQEGNLTEQDFQRIFSGDQEHMEKCMKGMLEKATSLGGHGQDLANPEKAIRAAEQLHAAVCGRAPPPVSEDAPASEPQPGAAPAVQPEKRAAAKPLEEEVRIPDHRLQYQKDAEGRYVGIQLSCTMPGVADMSLITLDVSEKHVRLITHAPAPKYAVNAGPFPVLIEPDEARAKYSKKRAELSVAVPAKKGG